MGFARKGGHGKINRKMASSNVKTDNRKRTAKVGIELPLAAELSETSTAEKARSDELSEASGAEKPRSARPGRIPSPLRKSLGSIRRASLTSNRSDGSWVSSLPTCMQGVCKLLRRWYHNVLDAVKPPGSSGAQRKNMRVSFIRRGSNSVFVLAKVPPQQIQRMREVFAVFDVDGSGSISKKDFHKVLMVLGSNPRDAEVEVMLRQIDLNKDGQIDFTEFAEAWWQREQIHLEEGFEEELKVAFSVFEQDEDGRVSVDELRKKLTSIGEKLSEEEVDALLEEVDLDGNGLISFEEFREFPCWRR